MNTLPQLRASLLVAAERQAVPVNGRPGRRGLRPCGVPLTRRSSLSRSRSLATAAALTLVAAVVALALAFAGGSGPPAYAVVVNANGTVTVTLTELIGVDGANAELSRLGVRVRIEKVEASCRPTARKPLSAGLSIPHIVEIRKVPGGRLSDIQWTIHPGAIPKGDTLAISARLLNTVKPPNHAAGVDLGLYRDPPPRCVRR
jgi:hypothetical protein